jgi:hypothetical protein
LSIDSPGAKLERFVIDRGERLAERATVNEDQCIPHQAEDEAVAGPQIAEKRTARPAVRMEADAFVLFLDLDVSLRVIVIPNPRRLEVKVDVVCGCDAFACVRGSKT